MYESNTDITGRIHETSVLPVIQQFPGLARPKVALVSFCRVVVTDPEDFESLFLRSGVSVESCCIEQMTVAANQYTAK